ncbi:type VI secretion system baseplate subunit TssK [Azospirillum griseum]|uniref:Type VI secretion system baseplate subunit TssK n=1 Tax=Azospirillum griseum TaxID=2496639 RepID=A0A3S0JKQ1_9PROT|nr:type VI secretion system baseplate subunit TssK [Azospirillum griseum]RTR22923.1 type VI secretion system baseplate subunit TssK [Azospirillum griseum]
MSHPPPDPIQWYEGMLLTPQHFQQAWLRQDAVQHYHMARLSPFHYGVGRLKVDPATLVVGIFRVLALDAVLPDGLIVTHPAEGAGDLQLSLVPHAEALKDAPATIHLAVPAYKPGSAAGGELARFRSVDGAPAVDENTGDNEQSMPRLQPRPILLIGEEVPQKYTAIPIARVVYRNESFQLTDYHPPCCAAGPESALVDAGRALAKRLREKASFLAGRMRAPGGAMQPAMLADSRHAVQCMVAGLPPLEALLGAGPLHPFALHGALCAVAGHVSTLGPGLLPPLFDRYDHADPLGSLRPVIDFIERMIDTVSESYATIRFAVDEAGFRLKIETPWLEGATGLLVGVRLAPGQTEAEAESWMTDSLIASTGTMGVLRERRLRGAARARVERDDRLEVTPERGVLLFRITADPAFLEAGQVLEIANPNERHGGRRPSEIALFVAPSGSRPAGASA